MELSVFVCSCPDALGVMDRVISDKGVSTYLVETGEIVFAATGQARRSQEGECRHELRSLLAPCINIILGRFRQWFPSAGPCPIYLRSPGAFDTLPCRWDSRIQAATASIPNGSEVLSSPSPTEDAPSVNMLIAAFASRS